METANDLVRLELCPKRESGRSDFPPGFVFGVGSSAYQCEGAAREDGRGESIWDTFSHTPGKTAGGATGDVANDQYHRYKEDIKLLVNMGIDSYRFSISWPRILPKGRGVVNEKGVAYYNNLINELLRHGIKPFVTIFHWDLPQALQDEYGGFLKADIVRDFTAYAAVCFERFGDRVKHWTTINEPLNIALCGYDLGAHAPGRCSCNCRCKKGDSRTEPYIVAHNMLLSHAAAVQLYRHGYQHIQKGYIGIALDTYWFEPLHKSSESDREAAQRIQDFYFGWFMDPLTSGQYPSSMEKRVGERLPRFNRLQSTLLRRSFDFIGINYYTALCARDLDTPVFCDGARVNEDSQVTKDAGVILTNIPQNYERNGVLSGPKAEPWVTLYPIGIQKLLTYVNYRYDNPPVFITENGVDEKLNTINHGIDENLKSPLKILHRMEENLNDQRRIQYYSEHLKHVHKAIRSYECDVRGYFAWTLLDDFEWDSGYDLGFGFYFIERNNKLKRLPRLSAFWFKYFLEA